MQPCQPYQTYEDITLASISVADQAIDTAHRNAMQVEERDDMLFTAIDHIKNTNASMNDLRDQAAYYKKVAYGATATTALTICSFAAYYIATNCK